MVGALGLGGEEGRHPQLGRGLLGLSRAEEQLGRVNALPVVVPWKESKFLKKVGNPKKYNVSPSAHVNERKFYQTNRLELAVQPCRSIYFGIKIRALRNDLDFLSLTLPGNRLS